MNFRIKKCLDLLKEVQDISSVLDVGCRDAALAKGLSPNISYKGADLFQNSEGTVDYVGDFLDADIDSTFDAVVALDVVEHVDNVSDFVDKMVRLSNKYVIINLPNTYSYLQIRQYFANGTFGKKYAFSPYGSIDRHRWLMTVPEIEIFYRDVAEKYGLKIRRQDRISFTGKDAFLVPPVKHLNIHAVMAVFEK